VKYVLAWNAVLIVSVSMPHSEFVAVTASHRFTRVLIGSQRSCESQTTAVYLSSGKIVPQRTCWFLPGGPGPVSRHCPWHLIVGSILMLGL